MAKVPAPKAEDSAEKAYAAAAEAAPVEFPPKAKRKPKVKDVEAVVVARAEPIVEAAPIEPEAAPVVKPEPLAEPEPELAPTVEDALPKVQPRPRMTAPKAKPLAKPIKAPTPKPVPAKPAPKLIAARKPVLNATPILNAKPAAPAAAPVIQQLKDKTMATTSDFIADVKTKAKGLYDKGTSAVGDMTDFAKGNVEAAVESGKILSAGLQEMGSSYVAETKSAFETMTADVKELAAQKTPVDFFKLHSELAKKNLESAVAFSTKSSEAMMKLATDAFAPLSGRVTLAVEKIKAAA